MLPSPVSRRLSASPASRRFHALRPRAPTTHSCGIVPPAPWVSVMRMVSPTVPVTKGVVTVSVAVGGGGTRCSSACTLHRRLDREES